MTLIYFNVQMESFNFLGGIELCSTVLNMADDLSKVLQASTISATEGQRLSNMTVSTLQIIRSEEDFNMFWQRVEEIKKEA